MDSGRSIKMIRTKNDYSQRHNVIQNSINLLSSEILRLIRLPYRDWKNQDKIRNLDRQIEYLEELMAAYERDLKKQE